MVILTICSAEAPAGLILYLSSPLRDIRRNSEGRRWSVVDIFSHSEFGEPGVQPLWATGSLYSGV